MRHAPTICPRSKASKSGSFPILEISTTNSEQMVTFYKELGYVNPSVLYLVLELAWFCCLAGDGGRGNRWQEPME
ncbi:hypothetical protein TNCV_651151 [Trichonephila clavipes]|nr:hypothetical protein TNCV_651151 [Trichonephila clavipes]